MQKSIVFPNIDSKQFKNKSKKKKAPLTAPSRTKYLGL